MVRIEKLSKSFGNHIVFQNVNLELNSGKIYGVVGKNGAGKTTLFNCICGLEKYQGSITSSEGKIKDFTGYLPAEPYFFDKITGEEYLYFMCRTRGFKLHDVEDKNIFELPLKQYISTYSTGMKKKIALLGILLQKNDVLILDEPFNGVDIGSNMLIIQIFKELQRLGKTILVSSHIFATLSEICDEIFFLENGEIFQKKGFHEFLELENQLKNDISTSIDKIKKWL
ncbi:ABC transporter ATP-binding protein [Myroides indicus]|uniref:ABC-2 type transport system ATP-binding protein n=1 Tax=Myroides indicus TaxID=1323422 RepID=A0A4V3E865_9FLAO|nr:ATP-binding cassette domain-containing protein [Myroides indicus]TDS55947.1 ABC-2 type transport system ATP-binding protein [Myroides indicus]